MNPQRSFIQTLIVPFVIGMWIFSLYLVYKKNPEIMLQETLHHVLSGTNKQTDIRAMGYSKSEDLFDNEKSKKPSTLSHKYIQTTDETFNNVDLKSSDLHWTTTKSFIIIKEKAKVTVTKLNGELLWTFSPPAELEFTPGRPAHLGSALFLTTKNGRIYSFDLNSGVLIWYIESTNKYFRSPLVHDEKLLLFIEEKINQKWALQILDAKTGENLNKHSQLELPLSGQPIAKDNHFYFATQNGLLRAITIEDGKSSWSTEASSSIRSGPSIINDRIYITNEDGLALGFDRKNGRKVNEVELGSSVQEPLKLVEGTNIVVTVDTNGYLIAADLKAAKRLWRYNLNTAGEQHPFDLYRLSTKSLLLLSFNSEVRGWTAWTACNSTRLCIFDVKSGRMLYRINLKGEPLAQPEFVGADENLIIPIKNEAGAQFVEFRVPETSPAAATPAPAAPTPPQPALDK
ncbi:MAG: PQQ-like beta-propeller repeat protein [Bdellovibrionales bacterium]|nr:PQQ-like beta-propeller repeat protein [Bdellovibrionales bacterium]